MATNLIITLGNRDLQLKKEIEGIKTCKPRNCIYFCLSSNRKGAKYFEENFNEFNDDILFPIAKPAVDYTINRFDQIDKTIIVSTDQQEDENVEPFFKENDTIFTAQVFEQYLRKIYQHKVKKIKHLIVCKNIIYHDAMYDFFTDRIKSQLRFEQNDNLVLFAQSGVDAINLALLLKCIEQYPQTIQLNKPENTPDAFPLKFPDQFIRNINRQKILHSLKNYNYMAVIETNYSSVVNNFARYAFARLSLDFDKALHYLNDIMEHDTSNRTFYSKHMQNIHFSDNDYFGKQKELYLSTKIALHNEAYADFLIKMFTLFEVILKPKVSELLGGPVIYNSIDNHSEWNKLIDNCPELKRYLKNIKIDRKNLEYQNPNKFVFKAILDYYSQGKKPLFPNQLFEQFKILSDLRNNIAHDLIKVSREDIEIELKKCNSDLTGFIRLTDDYFKVSGMECYDEINQKFSELLNL